MYQNSFFIKPCQSDLFKGLDEIQMKYAVEYGYEKDDLIYRDFTAITQTMNGPKKIKIWACCREHVRDINPGTLTVSRD